jgi:hypothetical protein
MAQAVSRRSLTAEARVRARVSPCPSEANPLIMPSEAYKLQSHCVIFSFLLLDIFLDISQFMLFSES